LNRNISARRDLHRGQEFIELAPKRILVVDDDTSVREMLAQVLQEEGYAVQAIANVSEAVEATIRLQIDLVVLEVEMGGEDGWSILEKLKRETNCWILLMTAAKINQFRSALSLRVNAVLEKPFDFPRFLATVRDILAGHRQPPLT
jgi:DNA-binding response OmpR family regulator